MRFVILAAWLAAIVAANLSVSKFGPSAAIYNAFIFIGLLLVLRDVLHDALGRWRFPKMLGLIALGGMLSYIVTPSGGKIALASAVAFVAAETVDFIVYTLLHGRPWLERSNASNFPGALVDSLVFPTIAFGGFIWGVSFGQFVAKVAGGLLFTLLLARRRTRAALAA
jgi:uncharacterized PurR-regulated membrane protein YhhQ (DUF165 family)